MVGSEYRITLDVKDMGSPVNLNVTQGDAGRLIYITLTNDGFPVKIEKDQYAVFAGKKPDGTVLWNSAKIEDNTIIYEITGQTTAVIGVVACQIRLYSAGNKLLSSPDFTLLVDEAVVSNSEAVSSDEITALTELVSEATALIKVLEIHAAVRQTEISLPADAWEGEDGLYSQVVAIEGVTEYSAVDLRPSAEQLSMFDAQAFALVAENEDGTVTVYAKGDKPETDYVIQVTITETEAIA